MTPSTPEALLRLIATAAQERVALAPLLREQGGTRGEAIAAALDQGRSLPDALAQAVPPEVVALIASAQLPLAQTALLAADVLHCQAQERARWWDTLLHPLITIAFALAGVVLTAALTGLAPSLPILVLALVLLASGIAGVVCGGRRLEAWVPVARRIREHLRLTTRYERLALVIAYRLPEADLDALVGTDATRVAALLAGADAGAGEARRLAQYHRDAARRCLRWVSWALAGLIYAGCGALLVAAAMAPLHAANEACARLLDDG